MRIGYGRVSTTDQNLDAQHDALTAAGCEKIFVDKLSGTRASRPELDRTLEILRAGDKLVITRLNRLGRSTRNLMDLLDLVQARGAELEMLDQRIDTSTPIGKMFFQIAAAFAEFERDLIVERTNEGLAAARARGRTGGQKPKLTPRQGRILQAMYEEQGPDGKRAYTVAQIGREFGVSPATVYRYLNPAA